MGYNEDDDFWYAFYNLTLEIVEKLEEINEELSAAETPEYGCPDKLALNKWGLKLLETAQAHHCFGSEFTNRINNLKIK